MKQLKLSFAMIDAKDGDVVNCGLYPSQLSEKNYEIIEQAKHEYLHGLELLQQLIREKYEPMLEQQAVICDVNYE